MKQLFNFRSQNGLFILIALLLAVILYSTIFCNQETKKVSENKTALTEYASLNDSVKYVGMQVCAQCHPDQYKTFIETGMGKSFDIASRKKSAANFDHSVIFDSYSAMNYKSHWLNDSLIFTEFKIENGDTVFKRNETVNYIVGSGQHTNSHLINVNGYLYQAPMTYYTQKQKWDLPPGFEGGFNSRFNRAIGLECITCHNSYPKFVQGSENKYDSIPNGISCERCHGPGEAHVKQIQSGVMIDTSKHIDYSIVNPAKLSIEKQFDVCQRCHIQGNAVLKKGKSFFDFRPGMHLTEVMDIFMPVFEGSNQEHIMASHAERLKQSKCYLVSIEKAEAKKSAELKPFKNALTCITCHNPHVSVKVTGTGVFNNACNKCHKGGGDKLCSENKSVLKKADNNCVGCHMPKSGAVDIPHVRVTDHFIRKPVSEKEVNAIRKFVSIACINNPDACNRERGIAFINYFEKFHMGNAMLDSAKKYFSDNTHADIKINFEELIRIAYLKENWNQVAEYVKAVENPLLFLNQTSYDNADALTCYRIAQSYENISQNDKAEIYFKRAASLAPFHLEILNKYANILAKNGSPAGAKNIYEKIISENPRYESAWSNLGFIELQLNGNTNVAEKCYDTALKLNHTYEPAVLNKAGLMIYQKRFTEAMIFLQSYLKQNPESKKAREILKQLKQLH